MPRGRKDGHRQRVRWAAPVVLRLGTTLTVAGSFSRGSSAAAECSTAAFAGPNLFFHKSSLAPKRLDGSTGGSHAHTRAWGCPQLFMATPDAKERRQSPVPLGGFGAGEERYAGTPPWVHVPSQQRPKRGARQAGVSPLRATSVLLHDEPVRLYQSLPGCAIDARSV